MNAIEIVAQAGIRKVISTRRLFTKSTRSRGSRVDRPEVSRLNRQGLGKGDPKPRAGEPSIAAQGRRTDGHLGVLFCRSLEGILHLRHRLHYQYSRKLRGNCRRIREDAAAAGAHRFTDEPVPAILPTGGNASPAHPPFPRPIPEIVPLRLPPIDCATAQP